MPTGWNQETYHQTKVNQLFFVVFLLFLIKLNHFPLSPTKIDHHRYPEPLVRRIGITKAPRPYAISASSAVPGPPSIARLPRCFHPVDINGKMIKAVEIIHLMGNGSFNWK